MKKEEIERTALKALNDGKKVEIRCSISIVPRMGEREMGSVREDYLKVDGKRYDLSEFSLDEVTDLCVIIDQEMIKLENNIFLEALTELEVECDGCGHVEDLGMSGRADDEPFYDEVWLFIGDDIVSTKSFIERGLFTVPSAEVKRLSFKPPSKDEVKKRICETLG